MEIFYNATAILPDRMIEDAMVGFEGSRIVCVSRYKKAERAKYRRARWTDVGGSYVAPGYIDLHVHGGGGADFMDGTVEAVVTACNSHARHGTTTIFPTTTTGAPELLEAMFGACEAARRQTALDIGNVRRAEELFEAKPDQIGRTGIFHHAEGERRRGEQRRQSDIGSDDMNECRRMDAKD